MAKLERLGLFLPVMILALGWTAFLSLFLYRLTQTWDTVWWEVVLQHKSQMTGVYLVLRPFAFVCALIGWQIWAGLKKCRVTTTPCAPLPQAASPDEKLRTGVPIGLAARLGFMLPATILALAASAILFWWPTSHHPFRRVVRPFEIPFQ